MEGFSIQKNNLSLLEEKIKRINIGLRFDRIEQTFKSKQKNIFSIESINYEYKIKQIPERLINLKPKNRFRDISIHSGYKKTMTKEHSLEINNNNKSTLNTSTNKSLFEECENIFNQIDNVENKYVKVKSIMKDILPYLCILI